MRFPVQKFFGLLLLMAVAVFVGCEEDPFDTTELEQGLTGGATRTWFPQFVVFQEIDSLTTDTLFYQAADSAQPINIAARVIHTYSTDGTLTLSSDDSTAYQISRYRIVEPGIVQLRDTVRNQFTDYHRVVSVTADSLVVDVVAPTFNEYFSVYRMILTTN